MNRARIIPVTILIGSVVFILIQSLPINALYECSHRDQSSLHLGLEKTMPGLDFAPMSLVFSPSGENLAYSGPWQINIMDVSTWTVGKTTIPDPWVYTLAYSPDGKFIAAGTSNPGVSPPEWRDKIQIFDANELTHIRTLTGHTAPINTLAFSPNGMHLASGADDGTLKIWDTTTWGMYKNISVEKNLSLAWLESLVFSPDGKYLATSTHYTNYQEEIIVRDTTNWIEIRTFKGKNDFHTTLAFSPNGQFLASSAESNIYIWDTFTWNNTRTFTKDGGDICSTIFSSDGEYFASSIDKNITIWETSSFDEIQTIEAHEEGIKSMAFSPVGISLVSCSQDRTINIWGHDSDTDGIADKADRFPDDPAASKDIDGDGYPDEWNPGRSQADSTTGLLLDALPMDKAASKDTDGDGYPDEWNPDMSKDDSTTGLYLDAFPTDPASSIDTDHDGYPDEWNPGMNASGSTTGITHLDGCPDDPAASLDADGDGYPDEWNPGKSQLDSTTGLHLDMFPSDRAASVDTDSDGYPDEWNPGFSQTHSITGLILDAFPDDWAASLDTDGDGYPNGWNPGRTMTDSTNGLRLDELPNDVAASVDTDEDGYPDEWNQGKSEFDSTTGLHLDKFPNDRAASVDTDDDKHPDGWNYGNTQADSTTGLYLDAFPGDPAASKDRDEDGYPDEWNYGMSQANTTTALYLDAFHTDPAASRDGDQDGYPDEWNPGKSQSDSTSGLYLDEFPTDPAASKDSDGDRYPDEWNYGKCQADSTTGLLIDAFPYNGSIWVAEPATNDTGEIDRVVPEEGDSNLFYVLLVPAIVIVIGIILSLLILFRNPIRNALSSSHDDKITYANKDAILPLNIENQIIIEGDKVRFNVEITNMYHSTVTDINIRIFPVRDALNVLSPPNGIVKISDLMPERTGSGTFLLKPLRCIKTAIECVVEYHDPAGELQIIKIKSDDTRLICPFVGPKQLTEREFVDVANRMETASLGFTVGGLAQQEAKEIVLRTLRYMSPIRCQQWSTLEGQPIMIWLCGESSSAKSVYLLAVVIKYNPIVHGIDIVFKGYCDSFGRLPSFMGEIKEATKHATIKETGAREISSINVTRSINIINSVIQKCNIDGCDDILKKVDITIRDSVVMDSDIGDDRCRAA